MRSLIVCLLAIPGADWPSWKPPGAGYSIRMPAGALSRTEKADERPDRLEVRSLTADEDGLRFAVYRHDLAAPVPAPRRSSILDSLRDGLVRSNRGAIRSESRIVVEGFPARDLVVDVPIEAGGAAILRARVILADRRVFQLYAWAPERKADRPEIPLFLDSFRLDSGGMSPFNPATAGFSARFPGAGPSESTDRIGDREWVVLEAKDGDLSFVVARSDLPESAAKDPKRALDLARDELLAASLGALTSERKVNVGRSPGREIVAETPRGDDPKGAVLTARLVLDGRRIYLVKVVAPRSTIDRAKVKAFLDSFRPSPPK